MKVTFVSATRRYGISAKTGNQYDMCKFSYAVKLESKKTEQNTFVGHGARLIEIDCSPSAVDECKDFNLGVPVVLQLTPNPENPTRNIVTSVKAA